MCRSRARPKPVARAVQLAVRRIGLAALVVGLAAAPAAALPPELEGRLDVEVLSCAPHPTGPGLLRAEVELRTGATEVRLPGLRCGAFVPGTDDVLFLSRVPSPERLPPQTSRSFLSVFPGDARHDECRCVVDDLSRLREVPRFEPEAPPEDPRAPDPPRGGETPDLDPQDPSLIPLLEAWLGVELPGDRPRASLPTAEPTPPPPPDPPAADVLRRERVLVPRAAMRRGPGRGPETGSVAAGDAVDVIALEAGWKWIRVPDTRQEGWIPDDASTSDLDAPDRLAAALAEFDPYLSPDRRAALDVSGLCDAGSAAPLDSLVFALLPELHAVFVTSLWHALGRDQRDAFETYVGECFDVRRIVDVSTGDELRNRAWDRG